MKKTLFVCYIIFTLTQLNAQNVGVGTTKPDASAELDVHSTSKGMLMPTMTTAQREAISKPALGLLVFDTDKATVMFFDGSEWRGLAFTDEDKVVPQNRNSDSVQANALFGDKVAISGNYAIIGAPDYTEDGKLYAGAAYIFYKGVSGWHEQKKLIIPDDASYTYFGSSVAISGDYAVVGCSARTVGANTAQGKVYVYQRQNGNWVLDKAFTKPTGISSDYFGWSVGIEEQQSGTVLLSVGIPYSDVKTTDAGEVYFYRRNTNGNWAFVQSIFPGDIAASDLFGSVISMDGDYMIIGAPFQDNSSFSYVDAGAAYIYVYGGGVWTLQQKLVGTVESAQFGASLSISGANVAVGAPWKSTFTNTSAEVDIYTRSSTTWSYYDGVYLLNTEVIPDAYQINNSATTSGKGINIDFLTFGISLAFENDNLLIGLSGGFDFPSGGSRYYSVTYGRAYMYKNIGGYFQQKQVITASNPFTGDLFGESVGISNGNFIIANPRANTNNQLKSGDVYFGNIQ